MTSLSRWAAGLASVLLAATTLGQYDPSNPFQEKRPPQPAHPAQPGEPEGPAHKPGKPGKPGPGSPEPIPTARQVITIDGRVITVSVEVSRDMMPGPRWRRGGGMMATVRLSTDHAEGLPGNIKSVRLWVSNEKRQSWRPALSVAPTFRHDPREVRLVARRGPRWEVNSKATATVLLVHGAMTYRLTMPVTVAGAY